MAGTADRKWILILMSTQVNVHLHIPINNMHALSAALKALGKYDLLVGVPADEARTSGEGSTARVSCIEKGSRKNGAHYKRRKAVGSTLKAPINNAALAYIHNNGSPSRNIPARPTLLPGINDAKDRIVKRLEDGAKAALDGSKDRVEKNFMAAGQAAVDAVKRRIRSNTPPPLSPKTLAARRRRGQRSTRTLVDTAQYLNSHTFVLKKAD
jgi:hypothetical protein